MKKLISLTILMLVAFTTFSQSNSYYKPGDTLYYQNNRATYLKTNVLVIIKETNVDNNNFNVEKHLFDTEANKFFLDSKFTTNGLQELKSNGVFKSFYKNGKIASEGETVNGKKGTGIWKYYYDNGKNKSEEKKSKKTLANDQKVDLVMSFWDKKGNQTVENGNGFAQFIDEEGTFVKGSFKDGFKNELWIGYDGKVKKYEENYKKGSLSKGTSWNAAGESFTYKEVNTPAYYKKRDNGSVRKYVGKKFNSNIAGVNGVIFVTFTVTKEGDVSNVNVERGLIQSYNSEVTKILSEMSGWTPAQKRGQSLESNYSLNLNFKG
ncbi:MAG: hypothetical protein V3V28_11305 [Polaribacter sp.]|uniref:hypothetical protein n=1 Tax=Polaribacter sp. TaxID=1920175 RepID=UPI002F35E88B